jgi:hypothetical protein
VSSKRAKVVSIQSRKASSNVIRAARDLYERTQTGEVTSFVAAIECADGGIATVYALGRPGDVFRLLGATHWLQKRLSDKGDL